MTNANQTANPPISTLKDGLVGVKIWCNATEKGNYYNAQPFRAYEANKDDWKETSNFSQADILKITRLLDQAYNQISEFRARDKQETTNQPQGAQ